MSYDLWFTFARVEISYLSFGFLFDLLFPPPFSRHLAVFERRVLPASLGLFCFC